MSFDQAGDFLILAAKKYNLHRQAKACLLCERVRQFFAKKYPQFAPLWMPQKCEEKTLFINTKNSAASTELFLRTHEILEAFEDLSLPEKIQEIRIVKTHE